MSTIKGTPFVGVSLQQLFPAFSAGLVIAVIDIFVEVSFAAMLFSGIYGEFVGVGIGLCLAGTFLHCLFTVLTSSSRNTIAVVQDAPIAIMAVVLATIGTQLSTASAETRLATALAVIVFTSLLAGLFFWALGRFNLGRLVRFIPYPVVGGFLAGTGFLLTIGGVGVMVDAPLGLGLLQADALVRWLPGFLYGVALLYLLRRYSQFWIISVLLVAGVLLFYGIYFLLGGTLASAADEGWLLGPFPGGRLWQPLIGLALTQADWLLVLANTVKISTVLLISSISLLFNVSGLEVISNEDVDLNRELRWSGLANLIGAVAISPVGFTTLSFSALGYRLGGPTRWVGVVTTFIIGLTVLFGAAALSNFPRMIAGGLLVFVGLSFLVEWLVDVWPKLPRLDYLLIWVILIVIAGVGFLEGVAVGILIAALLFLFNYSQIDIVRHATTRADYTGTTQRAPLYAQLLDERGERLLIVTLQGYIFFGTAHRLVEQITARIGTTSLRPLRFLVLDFRLVTGVDSSAIFSFARLKQRTTLANVDVVLTGLTPTLQQRLATEALIDSGGDGEGDEQGDDEKGDDDKERIGWRVRPTLADGVAWCEEQMIQTFADVGLADAPKSIIELMRARFAAAGETVDWLDYLQPETEPAPSPEFATFMTYLERIEVQDGEPLLVQDTPVDRLLFLEAGRARYRMVDAQQGVIETGGVEAGTVLGLSTFYAEQPARRTVTAVGDGLLYQLSRANLQRMETEHPHLAIALHRQLAAQIGQRAGRAEEVARTLQR